MTLQPNLIFDPEETLLSYTDRLSIMHTGRGMERLLSDRGIHKEHFISGRADAVAVLAQATGHDVEVLQRNAIRVFQRGASFRGEEISKSFLSPRVARYCPACLDEDGLKIERRQRLMWGFQLVSRCRKHGIKLAEVRQKSATNLRTAIGSESLAKREDACGPTPAYLDWLYGRVETAPCIEYPWLAGQTIEQVLAASEMIGSVLEYGQRVALSKLSPAQIEEATDIGFSIYCEGTKAIEEALDTIRQTSPATAVQAGPLAYYGSLYDWLDRRSNAIDPGPIRDILRDHIVKHSAVEPCSIVLGKEITERRFHTIYSLSKEVGIDRPRLSRVLKKLELVSQDATEVEIGNKVFEAAAAVPLIEALKTAVPLSEVPGYLGASKRQVEILYGADIVKPLVPRTGRGSVRRVVVARHHLDDLLLQMHALPEMDVEDGAVYRPIAFACQHGAGRFLDVFPRILAGQIPCVRNPDKFGIRSIYVDLRAVVGNKLLT